MSRQYVFKQPMLYELLLSTVADPSSGLSKPTKRASASRYQLQLQLQQTTLSAHPLLTNTSPLPPPTSKHDFLHRRQRFHPLARRSAPPAASAAACPRNLAQRDCARQPPEDTRRGVRHPGHRGPFLLKAAGDAHVRSSGGMDSEGGGGIGIAGGEGCLQAALRASQGCSHCDA